MIAPPVPKTTTRVSIARTWWIYQRERFPIVAHGLLIGAFSFCAVSLSRQLRGVHGFPRWPQIFVAFVTCFTFFLQLRIADEFKDFAEDAKYRPYRPVQRGLVTLRQLGFVFALGALLQLILALWLYPRLIILLGITWVYLAAMSKEFFIADWLRQRHFLYMATHMVIMPLVDLYATSTDWLTSGRHAPAGLIWFLTASFFNGIVIETGRKIRSPQDEETGVSTYSRVWGPRMAVFAWCTAISLTLTFACVVAAQLHMLHVIGPVLGACLIVAVIIGVNFLTFQEPGRGKRIEQFSGLWTLALYLSLGLLPLLMQRAWR